MLYKPSPWACWRNTRSCTNLHPWDSASDHGALRERAEDPARLLDERAAPIPARQAIRFTCPAKPWNWRCRTSGRFASRILAERRAEARRPSRGDAAPPSHAARLAASHARAGRSSSVPLQRLFSFTDTAGRRDPASAGGVVNPPAPSRLRRPGCG